MILPRDGSSGVCSSDLLFLANHHRYDSYDPNGPKVFLGEYASQENKWWNALVEASFMIGLERNADKVDLACYAPMLCNVDYINWTPEIGRASCRDRA